MGYSSHSIDKIGEPFLFIDEITFVIPEAGEVVITKDQFKFLFVLNGEAIHEVDGLEGPRFINTGDIVVCPGFQRHRFTGITPRTFTKLHVVRLFLDSHLIRHGLKSKQGAEFDLTEFVRHHFRVTAQFTGGIDSGIMECISEIRREAEIRDIGYRHRARALCTNLLVMVSRKSGGHDTPGMHTERKGSGLLVDSAKEYIMKNLHNKLTLGDIAWKVGKGEEHLARVFKKETGQSVFDFVREMRIEMAKTLLYDTSQSLTDIAAATGFSSLSFFSRTFKEIAGMSPSTYRNHIETTLSPPS